MNRWTIMWTSAPDAKGNVTIRACSGARVSNVIFAPGEEPTDEKFEADFAFALQKRYAKA